MFKHTIIYLCILLSNSIYSQRIDVDFSQHVHQIDQFFQLINEIKLIKNDSIYSNSLLKIVDRDKLLSLDSEINNFKYRLKKHDDNFDFFNSTWCAVIETEINISGKNENIILSLSINKNSDGSSNWVINNGWSVDFNNNELCDENEDFVSPMNHELKFIKLYNALSKNNNCYSNYFHKDFSIDFASVIYYNLVRKNIELKSINDFYFIFFDLEDYVFQVKYSKNYQFKSGWLISSIQNLNSIEKINFKSNILRYE